MQYQLFHSIFSGYDFGYLLKLLTDQPLPPEESEFFEYLRIYFPNIYDVKYLMKSCKNLKGGLQEVAEQLEVLMIICCCDFSFFLIVTLCISSTKNDPTVTFFIKIKLLCENRQMWMRICVFCVFNQL